MSEQWETRVESVPPKRGMSPTMIAVIATSVVLLAIVGATGGWLLAGSSPTPQASGSQSPAPVATSASPSPSAEDQPSEEPSLPSGSSKATFALPDPGTQSFKDYRNQLRSMKLGVDVRFGELGEAGQVVRTDPPVGAEVFAGKQIHLYVAGPAPETTVPTLIGTPCGSVNDLLGPNGLFPEYKSGRKDVVLEQMPLPNTTATWNDRVEVTCGVQATDSPAAQ